MTRRTAILSAIGFGILVFSSSVFFLLFRKYKKLDLIYLLSRKALIAEIAETILPATDTPGAKDAKVEDFVLSMVTDCTEIRSQYNFIEGLDNLEDLTYKRFNKDFIACNTKERIDILTMLEDDEKSLSGIILKIRNKVFGDSFLYLMKYYTVMGYCTSELGATQGLAYDYIPGSYIACMPLTSQKSWATE
ncbi:hypothetical protein D3C87_590510 [compost metagenome]